MINKFLKDPNHYGAMTVRQLVEVVEKMKDEFPKGLDTQIKVGDVEGNVGVVSSVMITAHRPEDVVLAIDPHDGDFDYSAD